MIWWKSSLQFRRGPVTWPHNSPDFDKFSRRKEKGMRVFQTKLVFLEEDEEFVWIIQEWTKKLTGAYCGCRKFLRQEGNNNRHKRKNKTAAARVYKKKLLYNLIGVYNHLDRYNFFHYSNNKKTTALHSFPTAVATPAKRNSWINHFIFPIDQLPLFIWLFINHSFRFTGPFNCDSIFKNYFRGQCPSKPNHFNNMNEQLHRNL